MFDDSGDAWTWASGAAGALPAVEHGRKMGMRLGGNDLIEELLASRTLRSRPCLAASSVGGHLDQAPSSLCSYGV
jgi:hypothetical protein